MKGNRFFCAGAVGAVFFIASTGAAEAQSLRTITDIWGGSNNGAPGCAATFGPAPSLGGFFNGGGFRAVGGNTSCGYAGSTTDQRVAVGPLVTTGSLASVSLGNPLSPYGSFGGSVAARAEYQSLGVQAIGNLVGGAVNTDADSAASAAFFEDILTATSGTAPNGSNGFIRYTFEIDGRLQVQPVQEPYHRGFAAMVMNYQVNDGPIYGDAYLSVQTGLDPVLSAQDGDLSGFSVGAGTISGSGIVRTGLLEIEYGTPFTFRLGMLAQTLGEGASDFLNTGKIVNIELFDAARHALGNADLVGALGIDYFAPSTVTPVPEPETWTLLAASFGLLAWLQGRRTVTR